MKLDGIRSDYKKGSLERDDLAEDPITQFSMWMEDALKARIEEPTAMTLATADAYGKPSARTLLLKGYTEEGFIFYTNLSSRKGSHLEINPHAAILFFWPELERQIRIEGRIKILERQQSVEYFDSRPYGSRLAASISPQSQIIPNRKFLEEKMEDLSRKFQSDKIPMPEEWGGYKLIPEYYEFWQGRANRLHDRFRYTLIDGKWNIDRLAP
ncbi:MAG: pyridoxamine 5'-phosphate oxidase [Bacteroidota bacterium]